MKIVVLDGQTLNPGDLDWAALRGLGDCAIHDRTAPEEIVQRAQGAEILLTNKTPLRAATIALLPALRYIGVLATGYNVVDVPSARAHGVVVTNVPAYGTRAVAQHVFALILELANHVGHHAQTVREGRWNAVSGWCYWDKPLLELDGLTLGIVGYGRIGSTVANLGRAFGLRVLIHTRTAAPGDERVGLDELFRQSDVVSLHCPLTPATEGLVNAARLASMKPGALLVNTSRGPLIVDGDLAAALNTGHLGGAALDVLSTEPPPADNPLLSAKNCLITPHIAWAARAARERLLNIAVENIRAFIAGQPRNVVG
jgi:glycerate dehydrogenase